MTEKRFSKAMGIIFDKDNPLYLDEVVDLLNEQDEKIRYIEWNNIRYYEICLLCICIGICIGAILR